MRRIQKKLKPYTVKRIDGSWRVLTPSGKAIAAAHSTRRDANLVANVFNATNRPESTVKTI